MLVLLALARAAVAPVLLILSVVTPAIIWPGVLVCVVLVMLHTGQTTVCLPTVVEADVAHKSALCAHKSAAK